MEEKPKKRKLLKWIIILIVLIIGGYIAYFFLSDYNRRNPFTAIPDNAIYIIESNNLTQGWNKINSSKIWQNLLANKKFKEINGFAKGLDSLIKDNKKLDYIFSDRKLLISAHMISNRDYDFLFIIDLKRASKVSFLTDYIKSITSYFGFAYSERIFGNNKILQLQKLTSRETLYITFIDNLMVCSYTSMLVDKSIMQKDKNYWNDNAYFKRAIDGIDNNSLFNLYINFSQLNNFINCFSTSNNDLVKSLSQTLILGAFNVKLEDLSINLSGGIAINDTIPSYFKALSEIKGGKQYSSSIVSNKSALYISLCFKNFKDFYEKLLTTFNTTDTSRSQNYNLSVKKVEKILKVNLEDDFFSWIGNEIAFIKLQPSANAREEDALAIFHTNDIEKAKSGLGHIMKQTKRRTLGLLKFDETEYKGYYIHYFNFSGLLKLFFGKLFSSIERPYFTYINNFVVFSNTPSSIMDLIDDYEVGNVLEKDESYLNFRKLFEPELNVFSYVQMSKIYSHLYYYSLPAKKQSIKDNKDVILSFTKIGLSLISKEKTFKTNLIVSFNESAAGDKELEDIEKAAEDLYLNEIMDSSKYEIVIEDKYYSNDGTVKIYFPDSKILQLEGRVENGKLSGIWRRYYESGKPESSVNYEDGIPSGVAVFYYNNPKQSTMVELNFKEGKIDGIAREYYENGSRKATVEYEEGQANGKANFYYDSGMLKIEGQYKNGVKQGKWKHYAETGEPYSKEKWKKGVKK